ncbi:MAG: hypothetical protein SF052_15740 [Bacteroidia bacterium]|nr:hypothetical protein [Bacteroidia bacterium]
MSKKNQSGLLWVVGLVGLTWYFTRTGGAVENLNYQVSKFRIKSISPSYVDTELTLTVGNPSGADLQFSEFYGALYYGDYLLSQFTLRPMIEIPARSIKDILVGIPLLVTAFAGAGIDLARTKKLANIRLSGAIKLNGVGYPIDYTFNE